MTNIYRKSLSAKPNRKIYLVRPASFYFDRKTQLDKWA